MFYELYKSSEKEVDAALFDDTLNIGSIVDDLFFAGCKHIVISSTPRNPQLEDTSFITSISFMQNGVVQFLFEGDVLSFDEDNNAVVWNEEDFLKEYELVVV